MLTLRDVPDQRNADFWDHSDGSEGGSLLCPPCRAHAVGAPAFPFLELHSPVLNHHGNSCGCDARRYDGLRSPSRNIRSGLSNHFRMTAWRPISVS